MKTEKQPSELLLTSEENFRLLTEHIPDGIIGLNRSWQFIYVNRNAEKMLQRKAEDLIGKVIWEEYPQSVDAPLGFAYRHAMETGESSTVETYSVVLEKWSQMAIYATPLGISVYFRDISEKRESELKMKAAEEKLHQFEERITDVFVSVDNNFRYTYANAKVYDMFGKRPEDMIGKTMMEVFPNATSLPTYQAMLTSLKEQRFVSISDHSLDGTIWWQSFIYPSPEGLSIFVKDISQEKRLERALEEQKREQQILLMSSALKAQEMERNYIGQELHDNVNQILVGIKLMLEYVKDHPEMMKQTLEKCAANLEQAINENRKIAHVLVTPDLRVQSLPEQLETLTDSMLTTRGLKVFIDAMDYNEDLTVEEHKLAAYRIAQEQCTNIIKHAKASAVNIQLSTAEDQFRVVIADDGIGSGQPLTGKGIGLSNIEGRLEVYGGQLLVETGAGEGFRLTFNIPLHNSINSTVTSNHLAGAINDNSTRKAGCL